MQHFVLSDTLYLYRWKEGDRMYDYDTCSESVLVKRARKKDVKAFSKLYENVYKDLYYFALYMMKNPQDAEDVVSETVLSVYENIYSLQKDEAFRGWIFKILSNVCKKKLKVRSRQETFKLRVRVYHIVIMKKPLMFKMHGKYLQRKRDRLLHYPYSEGTTAKKSARYLRNKENQ